MLEIIGGFIGIGVTIWTLIFIYTLATGEDFSLNVKVSSPMWTLPVTILGWPLVLFGITVQLFEKGE